MVVPADSAIAQGVQEQRSRQPMLQRCRWGASTRPSGRGRCPSPPATGTGEVGVGGAVRVGLDPPDRLVHPGPLGVDAVGGRAADRAATVQPGLPRAGQGRRSSGGSAASWAAARASSSAPDDAGDEAADEDEDGPEGSSGESSAARRWSNAAVARSARAETLRAKRSRCALSRKYDADPGHQERQHHRPEQRDASRPRTPPTRFRR